MRRLATAVLMALLIASAARAQAPDALTTQVKTAVDSGFLNLAAQQQADGSWIMGGYSTAITAMCIDAFELHGHLPENDPLDDPYALVVDQGFKFLLTKLQAVDISGHPAADTNGNGIGLKAIEGFTETYATAMCLMAFADSRAFASVATAGPVEVFGRSYLDIAQDMVDFLAFGQNDLGNPRGGWGYSANQGYADNDNSRWVAMALYAAESRFGLVIPAFVRTELNIWVTYIQHGTDGYSYYSTPVASFINLRKTAGLVSEFAFLGDPLNSPRMLLALGYIETNWGDASVANANTSGNTFAVQAMRRCASATGLGPMVGAVAWYEKPTEGSAPALVDRQNPDGSWPSFDVSPYDAPPLTTALALAALQVMRMGVDRTTVAFTAIEDDATDPSETVIVEEISRKLGPYYLNWTAADISSASWLSIGPAAGGDGAPMTLTASLSGMSPGDHSATVEIGDPKAANGPLTVDVTFSILPIGGAAPDAVSFIGDGCSAGTSPKGPGDARAGLPYVLLLGMILARCVGRRRSPLRT